MQTNSQVNHLEIKQCEGICTEYLKDDICGIGLQLGLARRQAKEVIEQLVKRYGILVERAPDEVNFVHLSFQEYLVAEFMVRKPVDFQINQLSHVWLNRSWRESLICWFGLLGSRSEQEISLKALEQLTKLGETGELQRMQSLMLRTEIATTDLRFPVKEARKIVEEAAHEVETSAFSEFRTTLARNLAIGALGSSVRGECRSVVKRWMPGYAKSTRLHLLQTFKSWEPSDTLRKTLLRAHYDEESQCRHAAAETFATLFFASSSTLSTLKQLAMHHVRPEVRAAALHGLESRPEWASSAVKAAEVNAESCNTELLLVVSRIRVRESMNNDTDLNRIWRIWTTDSLDFCFRKELVNILCDGWPQHPEIRELFVRQLGQQQSTWKIELPLEYLVRCYPNDEEVATILAGLFERFGTHMQRLDSDQYWEVMWSGYREHSLVTAALRAALNKENEKYGRDVLLPHTSSAFAFLGGDEERDHLLASYETADYHSRHWIVSALFRGWPKNKIVQKHIRKWADGPVEVAAFLADWGDDLFPDPKQREEWLRRLIVGTRQTRTIGPLVALIKEFPDTSTKEAVINFLDDARLWYYHRMQLQGLFAGKFPDDPKSLEIVTRSLSEIDGPEPGDFAASFQSNVEIANRLLAAAVTAPVDARMTVTSVLRSRPVDYQTVMEMIPEPYAEEASAVRASGLMAQAKAVHGCSRAMKDLSDSLASDLASNGFCLGLRRRAALSGFLELELYEDAVKIIANQGGGTWNELTDLFDRDPISIEAVIEHWDNLFPFLVQKDLELNLPIETLLDAGYGSLLEQNSTGRKMLDEYFKAESPQWISPAYLEIMVRRQPKSESLRKRLLSAVVGGHYRRDVACAATRLLAEIFSSSPDIWTDLFEDRGPPEEYVSPNLEAGVMGYLVLGWPDGKLATWARSVPHRERLQWSPRDCLLVAVASKDTAAAEMAVLDLLAEPLRSWEYDMEDTHALRMWAQSEESSEMLADWTRSNNPSYSLTALSLISNGYARENIDKDELRERFNAQIAVAISPADGLNAATGRHTSWAVDVYSILQNSS